jgi:hypothetical protein
MTWINHMGFFFMAMSPINCFIAPRGNSVPKFSGTISVSSITSNVNRHYKGRIYSIPADDADDNNDIGAPEEGNEASNTSGWMAELFQIAKDRNIALDDDDFGEEDDDDDDEVEVDIKNVVLQSPPSTTSLNDSDIQDDENEGKKVTPYKPPSKVPDSDLTAVQVVELVLEALAHNDEPTPNRGTEILVAYASVHSQIVQLDITADEYATYLQRDNPEYCVLYSSSSAAFTEKRRVEKVEYSPDGSKAYVTARIPTFSDDEKESTTTVPVNFILSCTGDNDGWMIDSMLIRPPGMRRNRRR